MSEIFRVHRHRVTIQRQIVIPTLGRAMWRSVGTIWAEIHDDVITIRYMADLFPAMRVIVGKKIYEIVGVVDRPGKTRLVELHVSEIRASAESPDALWR